MSHSFRMEEAKILILGLSGGDGIMTAKTRWRTETWKLTQASLSSLGRPFHLLYFSTSYISSNLRTSVEDGYDGQSQSLLNIYRSQVSRWGWGDAFVSQVLVNQGPEFGFPGRKPAVLGRCEQDFQGSLVNLSSYFMSSRVREGRCVKKWGGGSDRENSWHWPPASTHMCTHAIRHRIMPHHYKNTHC